MCVVMMVVVISAVASCVTWGLGTGLGGRYRHSREDHLLEVGIYKHKIF